MNNKHTYHRGIMEDDLPDIVTRLQNDFIVEFPCHSSSLEEWFAIVTEAFEEVNVWEGDELIFGSRRTRETPDIFQVSVQREHAINTNQQAAALLAKHY